MFLCNILYLVSDSTKTIRLLALDFYEVIVNIVNDFYEVIVKICWCSALVQNEYKTENVQSRHCLDLINGSVI